MKENADFDLRDTPDEKVNLPDICRELVTQTEFDMNLLGLCLSGARGEDQSRIAKKGLEWLALLLRKNADYGSSAWKKPVLAPECDNDSAMRVRMSDKIERIQSLLSKGESEVSESLEDTIGDLGSYCLLWLARPK